MPVTFGQSGGSGGGTWGTITGTLSNQTDLQTALNAKVTAPSSTTDNAVTRFDGTAGQIQNSGWTLDDNNVLICPTNSTNTHNQIRFGGNSNNFITNEPSGTDRMVFRVPTNGRMHFHESTVEYFVFIASAGYVQLGKYDGTNKMDIIKTVAKNTAISGWVPSDVYYSNTAVGNVGSGEDDLISKTLHARTLATNGDAIEGYAWGTFAANGNNKTIKFYIAGTAVFTLGPGAYNGGTWWIRFSLSRTGSSTQKYAVQFVSSNATAGSSASSGTLTFTDTNNQTIKFTGEATSDNDILCEEVRMMHRPPSN